MFVANFLTRIFGSRNDRLIRRYEKKVSVINELESGLIALNDNLLKAKTLEFRERYNNGETLDQLLPEAFAVAREASVRTMKMRPFDVQLIGGMVLHAGNIAEMRTGEGKTLMSTLPAYLNAISGNGVHIVTVNEYLAQRDADWMRPIYEFLGLTVGVSKSGQTSNEKCQAYESDITYATNNELGFDYLRDNLAFSTDDKSQRGLNFAIVDEVDSILIDEARTPLIISGPTESNTDLYSKINKMIPNLNQQKDFDNHINFEIPSNKIVIDGEGSEILILEQAIELAEQRNADLVMVSIIEKIANCKIIERGDFTVDEKAKQTYITEEGHSKVEAMMSKAGLLQENESLYDATNIKLLHHLNSALRAHAMYQRDIDYIVKGGEVVIVDEFTGRTMPGRRWGDGLHQAIEAKERVSIKQENQTIASITFQNYFRLYKNLSGMTGTADTEAFEFQQIYGLEVVVIPTHKDMIRKDQSDLVYLTEKDKFEAIINDIVDCSERGQPVLVGTTSIEASELLSSFLKKKNIKHNVLNAKQHEREAHIVQNAGKPGAITIATNMAGRGTDIVLGGILDSSSKKIDWQKCHDQVLEAGGLHIIGTERHESRRIDNQLRGRSGRQGDPGSSRFYLSMEDSLMRIFGDPERTKNLLSKAGMREGEAIESKILSRQIERAQRKVEAHNFDIRKNLLEYDDVANDQRKVVYHQRTELMDAEEIEDSVSAILEEVVGLTVEQYVPIGSLDEMWDLDGLTKALDSEFSVKADIARWVKDDTTLSAEGIVEKCIIKTQANYKKREVDIGKELMRNVEKKVMLHQLDHHWKEHLASMDHLRQGIGLRSYAQKNPKQEYKREAFEMFGAMLEQVKHDTISILARIRVQGEKDLDKISEQKKSTDFMKFHHASPSGLDEKGKKTKLADLREPYVRDKRKVGRNTACPCGSGKKFKHCCGQLDD
ncbi:MAG: preprotein translocase subunit SecA [Woeseia sp.]|nr:preprotein translocase subunit SecA [Woeseia sp.]